MPFAFIHSKLVLDDCRLLQKDELKPQDLLVTIDKHRILIKDLSPLIPSSDVQLEDSEEFLLLGQFNEQNVLIHRNQKPINECDYPLWWDLRHIALEIDSDLSSLAAQAMTINHWHLTHKYCGKCGSKTVLGKEHSRVCSQKSCQETRFPRIDPAVIVSVINEYDEILLGRQAEWDPGRYSVLAGFLSHGESLEQAVIREVKEESGVNVDSVQYVASQPWPFPGSLMVGFTALAKKQPIDLGDDELEHAMWISREELQAKRDLGQIKISVPMSISRYLIDCWLEKTET